jgi:hypothetical protein
MCFKTEVFYDKIQRQCHSALLLILAHNIAAFHHVTALTYF